MSHDTEKQLINKSIQSMEKVAKDMSNNSGMIGIITMLKEPIMQITGTLADELMFQRWKKKVRIMQRAMDYLLERGYPVKLKIVPTKFMLPLLDAAAMEESDSLQELWAMLLANAADANSEVEAERGLVSILQDFGSMEARLLQKIYNAPPMKGGVPTKGLPDEYIEPGEQEGDSRLPPEPVQVSLWHLKRLGCIESAGTWASISGINRIYITALGKKLMKACTAPSKSS